MLIVRGQPTDPLVRSVNEHAYIMSRCGHGHSIAAHIGHFSIAIGKVIPLSQRHVPTGGRPIDPWYMLRLA